ncbi:integral membrane [Fusarium albosuccineum]|uniref:Integral membrane n=1 Tax=Fusarium albosuccineum TaxID=1237068 RepID=A0A8H4KZ96_9HYPO|nr:integral membrane [Fusarium albosuccineum]
MEREYIPMVPKARDALIAISFLWVIFAIVVFLRLLGRIRGIGLGVDDILAAVALVCHYDSLTRMDIILTLTQVLSGSTIGMNAAVFVSGVGYNFDPESPVYPKLLNNMEYILMVTFAFTLIYLWALAALKLSQLFFYLRAFSIQLRTWIYAVIGIVVAWALTFTFVFIFLCHPVEQQWTLQRIGRCLDQILVLKCIIMTNVVTDLFIVILPIWTVWNLQMRRTEKVAVIACFALGLACCVIGIVRFWQIYVIDLIGNLTGTSLTTFMLCTVELMLAGLCINIPMLRPFYLRCRAKYKSSQATSSTDQSFSKGSRKGNLVPEPAMGHHTAWIELSDKDQETGSNDDAGSERKLTQQPPSASIQVSKRWDVARDS